MSEDNENSIFSLFLLVLLLFAATAGALAHLASRISSLEAKVEARELQ